MTTVGVIGQGFVGNAVARAFRLEKRIHVETYDKYVPAMTTMSLGGLVRACDTLFVCVPTPDDDGDCDISIVESVLGEIAEELYVLGNDTERDVVIKSTVIPGTTDMLQERHVRHGMHVIFNPEFLNAKNAFDDFINQEYVVLGGEEEVCARVAELYTTLLPDVDVKHVDAKTAETVKYVKNCFFATKVSFANEMFQICRRLDVNYDEMIEIAMHDDRMGWEHLKVPGPTPAPDGSMKFGFGGACLPKDLRAFIRLAKTLEVDPKVMSAAWEKNLEVRPERDWMNLPSVTKRA